MIKKISILGSTGSIGVQTLDVIDALPDNFKVVGLSAGRNIDLFKTQLKKHKPTYATILSETDLQELADFITKNGLKTTLITGKNKLNDLATLDHDLLIVAIVGTASLEPTYKAIEKGIPIGLACKEILVAAGNLIMNKAKETKTPILPIDSEHAAIKQCLAGINENLKDIDNLILTASGGPFWKKPKDFFKTVQVKDALNHPNWTMGQKITIDSATLMNKGLEVIEAHHLFQVPFDQIKVIIHPQSIIHSMVEFTDGTILSQMGLPDMRFPIQYVLTYPEKNHNPWPKTQLSQLKPLTFFDPDFDKFPLLKLAFDCGKKGGTYPVVLNAANEAAVAKFLAHEISFLDIHKQIITQLETFKHVANPSLSDIIQIDQEIKNQICHATA